MGVRVATPLAKMNGGLITSRSGAKTAKETWGKAHQWCDHAGVIAGRRVGITLLPDPANFRPSWFHNRSYDLMTANPFGRQAMQQGDESRVGVKRGATLRLRHPAACRPARRPSQPGGVLSRFSGAVGADAAMTRGGTETPPTR